MTVVGVAAALRVVIGHGDADRAGVAGRVVAGREAVIEVLVLDREADLAGRRVDRRDREHRAVGGRTERVADVERGHAGRVRGWPGSRTSSRQLLLGSSQLTVSVWPSKQADVGVACR